MQHEVDAGFFWFVLAAGVLIGFLGTSALAHKEQQRQAVQHKAAQWVTQEDGSAHFKWNDEINIEKKEK